MEDGIEKDQRVQLLALHRIMKQPFFPLHHPLNMEPNKGRKKQIKKLRQMSQSLTD